MFTDVSLPRATSSECRFTGMSKNIYMNLKLHTGIITWLTNRKLGDVTVSDRHTKEESIRIKKEVGKRYFR